MKQYKNGFVKMTKEELAEIVLEASKTKHGKWVHLGGDEWCCSECGFVITTEGSWEKPTGKFCSECGAKMDLGE